MSTSSKWWDINTILSYNKLLNFVVGLRGGGKTYGSKKKVIQNFIRKHKQFVYIRRYKSEMREAKKKFFDDVKQEFPDLNFKVVGNTALIDDKIAGFFITLSISSTFKSVPFPDVNFIIFDEFLIDKSTFRYLPNEVTVFLDCVETIFRNRDDGTILCIGNAISFSNPYFLYFSIVQTGKEFFTLPNICVQHYTNEQFIEEKYRTRFGQLVKGTEYANYSIENNYILDSKRFIERRSKSATFRCAIIYKGRTFGFWRDLDLGRIYCDQTYDPQSGFIFTLLAEDHKTNAILVRHLKNNFTREIKYAFEVGALRFSDQVTKNLCFEILSML